MGALDRLGLRAASDVGSGQPVVAPGRRLGGARLPVVRSGTALEVAELAWFSEGISREAALSIPSVLACRNLVVDVVIQLGLYRYRGGDRLDPGSLLTRPDPSTTMPATLGGTVDDLLFHGRAYWLVLDRDAEKVVTRARWTPVDDVTPETKGSGGGAYSVLTGYRVAGRREIVAPEDVIRFDSPNPGILDVSGRTLAGALETYAAQRRYASVDLPAGTLTNESGVELSDEESAQIVSDFQAARRERGVAWLQGVSYSREAISPTDLGLQGMTDNIATEVSRLFNVPVAMIGASPSGGASAILYANLTQQLALLSSVAVAPHLRTIEATLSEVIPRGQEVAFDVQAFLRSDPQAAAEYVISLIEAGLVSVTEGRSMLGIPAAPPADLTPGRV